MKHFFRHVPLLGNVAVSRHAQRNCEEQGITENLFERVLMEFSSSDMMEAQNLLRREGLGVRMLIILDPEPPSGARLVKTVFRVQEQAVAKRTR